ncbi:hypothetical protein L6164_026717 [Bauhinia variegata]|uniref:Uncharacterized protein n=1 Tax=Bauhinia variegata TaxID=167791 RepID=A0ACB9LRK6_BAUVA|nr:hypothetical protein L6164_026717 [Bauhinia variegata]
MLERSSQSIDDSFGRPSHWPRSFVHVRSLSRRSSELFLTPPAKRILAMKDMNWIQRKIYLYNVTFGLFMLDWWERFLFNTMVVVLMWFVFYNGSRHVTEFFRRHVW